MVLVGTLGDTLVKELAGIVKFPNRRALVPYYEYIKICLLCTGFLSSIFLFVVL